jgi:hypothetical protein
MTEEKSRLSLEKLKNACLVFNQQIFRLNSEITRIGRKLDNHFVIHDLSVSREHAEIRYEDGEFTIIDLNSTAGTYVNNKKIDKKVLYTGDIISLGIVPMMFVHDGPREIKIFGAVTDSLK